MEFQPNRTDSEFNRKTKDGHECSFPETVCVI